MSGNSDGEGKKPTYWPMGRRVYTDGVEARVLQFRVEEPEDAVRACEILNALEAECDALREALESNARLKHLKQFPHLKPNDWEQKALEALSQSRTKGAR